MNAVFSKAEIQCRWFAMCTNEAIAKLPHPILGLVDVCDRCLYLTMRRTEFTDYEGAYTLPVIMYKLVSDHNIGLDDMYHMEEPFHASDAWDIPMGDLLCIEGVWEAVKLEDPGSVNWESLGVDEEVIGAPNGVYYDRDYMIIKGDNSMNAVFWLFKKHKVSS